MMGFTVLEEHNRIYLNDRTGKKTTEFNLDGNFIRDIKTTLHPADLRFMSPSKYYLHYPKGHYLRLVDMEKSETTPFIPHVNGYNGYGNAIETQADGSFLYSPGFHDSVYTLLDDTIKLKFAFDFRPYQFTGEDQMAELANNHRMSYAAGRLFPAGPYYDFPDFFHFRLFTDELSERYSIETILWMKEDQSMFHLDDNSDDILFCYSEHITGVSPDNEWIAVIDPVDLLESKDKIKENQSFKYSNKLHQQIENLKEDDNPVLAIFELK